VLVSIVTPSYQQAAFIERTLESVARQGGDVEHIVMDGGSTDGTVEILERWRDRI
jgi:glycosyltransferase involved in cell wall biosynthesis